MNPGIKSKFENLKKTVIETGMNIAGEGARVDFRRRAESLENRFKLSKEQAEKKELSHAIQGLYHESKTGIVPLDSKEYENFMAALTEMIGDTGIASCKQEAQEKNVRPVSVHITAPDVDKVMAYYKKKVPTFPPRVIMLDTAQEIKYIEQVSLRAGRELLACAPSKESFNTILATHPDMRIDIGRILLAKAVIEQHEKKHRDRLAYEKSVGDLKQTAKETTAEAFVRAPSDFLKKINALPAGGKGFDGKNIIKGMGYAGELLGRELKAGGKLSIDFLKTIYRFGKTQK